MELENLLEKLKEIESRLEALKKAVGKGYVNLAWWSYAFRMRIGLYMTLKGFIKPGVKSYTLVLFRENLSKKN